MSVGSWCFEGAPHHFDQTQAELIAALRQERKGFFVSLASQDVFGFSISGDAEELVQFLKDVVASAQAELAVVEETLARVEQN